MPSLQNTALLRQLLPELAKRDAARAAYTDMPEATEAERAQAAIAADVLLSRDTDLLHRLVGEIRFWQRAALTASRLTHDATTVGLNENDSVLAGILYGMTAACTPDHTATLSITDLYEASH